MAGGGPGQTAPPPGQGGALNPEVQAIIKLVRTDPDFRNELKSVIAEALQPDLAKLKSELMGQMSANNAAAATSNIPPPMDYESIIQRDFPGSVLEEWSHNDESGSVYGFAETVSSHLIKHNNMTYLCDIKEVRSALVTFSTTSSTSSLGQFQGYPLIKARPRT